VFIMQKDALDASVTLVVLCLLSITQVYPGLSRCRVSLPTRARLRRLGQVMTDQPPRPCPPPHPRGAVRKPHRCRDADGGAGVEGVVGIGVRLDVSWSIVGSIFTNAVDCAE
jgi:hypothetical protein